MPDLNQAAYLYSDRGGSHPLGRRSNDRSRFVARELRRRISIEVEARSTY